MTDPLPRGPVSEPILTADDRACWDAWMKGAREHARTQAFRRRVERARAGVVEALSLPGVMSAETKPAVSWSCGKDSTVMTHLICVEAGAGRAIRVVSEKDDLDYPGEREYAERYAAAWGLDLEIITPAISPAAWVEEAAQRGELRSYDDIHTRAAGLSKACFYRVMEASNEGRPLVCLGLRREESNIRTHVATQAVMAASKRRREGAEGPRSGLTYWHKGASQWRCLPVAEFRALDVYAYLASRDIDPLPVYRCIGLMHRDRPGMIRKSWWLPGGHAADGQVAWLRRYFPSLYRRLVSWMPDASLLT